MLLLKYWSLFWVLGTLLLLQGCSNVSLHHKSDGGDNAISNRNVSSISGHHNKRLVSSKYANFMPETLYDLLVAELSFQDQTYEIALGNYLKQAHSTRDIAIIKRAYKISSLINASQAALDAAQLWIEVAPNDIRAKQALGREKIKKLIKKGQFKKALAEITSGLKKGVDFIDDLLYLSQSTNVLENKRKVELLSMLDQSMRTVPKSEIYFLMTKAYIYQQMQEYQQALKICEKVIARNDKLSMAIKLKGALLLRLDRPVQSKKFIAKSIKKSPANIELRLFYTHVLFQQKDRNNQEIKKQLEVLYSLYLESSDVSVLVYIALATFEGGLIDNAEVYFSQLVREPRYKDLASYYLARIKEAQGKENAALELYLQVEPGRHYMASRLAFSLIKARKKQLQELSDQLKFERLSYPVYAVLLYMLESEILILQKEYTQAKTLLSDGIARYPKNVDLLYARAMVCEKLADNKVMEQDLKAIILLDPDNSGALNALGFHLLNSVKRLNEAKPYIEKAFQLNPHDPAILDSMGWLHYRLGHYDKALGYLKMAYDKFYDPEIAAHLGEVLWALKNEKEAKNVWEAALKRSPGSQIILDTRKRLTKTGGTVDAR